MSTRYRFVVLAITLAACYDADAPTARPELDVSAATPLDLGTLGGKNSRAIGINDSGSVVGASNNSRGQARAFKWSSTTHTMTQLATLASRPCQANHINNNDQIVGYCQVKDAPRRAVIWQPWGQVLQLPVLPGDMLSEATDINDAGVIVGWSGTLANPKPVRWVNGLVEQLAPGGPASCPEAYVVPQRINRRGWITGNSIANCENEQMVLWDSTGAQANYGRFSDFTYVNGMNDSLTLVGRSPDGAVLWTAQTGWQLIAAGAASSVSPTGTVVGYARGHAFYWTSSLGSQSLGELSGYTGSRANDINKNSQAAGFVSSPTSTRAVLWSIPN